jgi:hypothetical protein
MVVAILTGLWACLRVILLADSADSRLKQAETVRNIVCLCEAMARRRFNVSGDSVVEPKGIRIASVRDLCLFIRGIRLLNLC